MSKRKKDWKNATLGVDIGSTSCRMILLCDGKGYVVECHQHGIHTEFEPGDFSSSCYPFESDREKKPYIENNKTDPTRRATSIKPIFLVLADIPRRRLRPLLSEYPHADEILERLDSEDRPFRQRLHAAIAGFCDALRKRLVALCNKEELRVVSVGISVPSQWPAEVEDFMADVFVAKLLKRAECVQVSRDQILFHSETQALAHNVFKEAGRLLEPRGTTMKGFLLLDFGGQNLNISMYHAQFARNGAVVFYDMGYSMGVVGGSGILDHHIGEYCQEEARLKGVHLTWMDKQNLIEQFRAVKKLLGRGHYIPENRHTLHSREIDIHLTPEIITSVFNGAMRAAFQKCTEAFEICDQANEDRGTQVLVTGGTARSKFLQEKLELMCRKADLDEVIFMEDLLSEQGRYPSLNVAKGAAYANENCMTPAEFLERGAAIGYQMRQAGGPVWNSRAPILCRTEADTTPQEVYVEDGDELKLICEPFTIPSAPNTTILYRRAYDLYTIGIFRAGKITLKTSFLPEHDVPGGRMLVLIVEWRKKLDNAVPVPTYGHRLVGSVTLPLEFHRSSSCMLVCEGDFPLEISRDAMVRIAGTPAETGTGDHADEQVGAHGAGHGGTSLGGSAGVAADTSGGGTGAALPTLPAGQLMHNATYSRPPADLDAGDHPMSASDEEDAAWDLDYIPVEGGEGRRAKRRRGRR